jgi:hypothetical protein
VVTGYDHDARDKLDGLAYVAWHHDRPMAKRPLSQMT